MSRLTTAATTSLLSALEVTTCEWEIKKIRWNHMLRFAVSHLATILDQSQSYGMLMLCNTCLSCSEKKNSWNLINLLIDRNKRVDSIRFSDIEFTVSDYQLKKNFIVELMKNGGEKSGHDLGKSNAWSFGINIWVQQ